MTLLIFLTLYSVATTFAIIALCYFIFLDKRDNSAGLEYHEVNARKEFE